MGHGVVTTRPVRAAPTIPSVIGRYRVRRELGAGGMGVVVLADDPQLQRPVALKIVAGRGGARPLCPEVRARMQREAQALAQLSHPAVVAIYDVTLSDAGLCIAMEYVRGQTLRQWLGTPRSAPEIIEVLVQAGHGLAAAHRAGLVHRDFKPGNVLVGDDGRVRVADFGLARWAGELGRGVSWPDVGRGTGSGTGAGSGSGAGSGGVTGRSLDALASPLTGTGFVLGTPAYMAPEQHRGDAADPRSDQYAFCVTAFEALIGHRPFAGHSPEALVRAKRMGPPHAPPSGLPARLYAAIVRGLATDPAARWPSMEALLTALRPRSRRLPAAVTIAAMGVVVGAVAIPGIDASQQCAEPTLVWDERRDAVVAGLQATGLSYASQTAERVASVIDGYAQRWANAHRLSCRSETVDRARACLHQGRAQLDTLLGQFEGATPATVRSAVGATLALPDPHRCLEPGDGTTGSELTPQLVELRTELSRARALDEAGQSRRAAEIVEAVMQQIPQGDPGPLLAEALAERGAVHESLGRYDAAAADLESAFFEAQAGRQRAVAARAARNLVLVHGARLADHDAAQRWEAHATAASMGAAGEPTAALAHAVATARRHRADYEGAIEAYERALAIAAADPMARAHVLSGLGNALADVGRYELALPRYAEALALTEQALGSLHPDVAMVLNNIALVHWERGELAPASKSFERALAVFEGALGSDHPHVATVHNNLGNVAADAGRHDDAIARFQVALRLRRREFGPEHPAVATVINNLATSLHASGDLDRASTAYQDAQRIWERHLGPDHPDVAMVLNNRAAIAEDRGELRRAVALYERCIAIRRATLDPDHPLLVAAIERLAALRLRMDGSAQ